MSRFLGIAIFVIIAAGLAIHAGVEFPRLLDWIGHLPGDIRIKKGQVTLYVPLASSLLISAVLSLIAALFSKGK